MLTEPGQASGYDYLASCLPHRGFCPVRKCASVLVLAAPEELRTALTLVEWWPALFFLSAVVFAQYGHWLRKWVRHNVPVLAVAGDHRPKSVFRFGPGYLC